MRGFTLMETLIAMMIFLIVSASTVLIMNSVFRNSLMVFDRITQQHELAKIDALIRRELLKAGPTIEGLTVTGTSIEFYAIVPFSKQLYGTYASATKLRYRLLFSNNKLELQVTDGANYVKRMTLGEVQDCRFEADSSRPNKIHYVIEKKKAPNSPKLVSSVVLYNLK